MPSFWSELAVVAKQAGLALAYYSALNVLMRLAGKRLAGQTATLDLIVLISLGVTLQTVLLEPGRFNAFVFVCSVFLYHKALTWACRVSPLVRGIVRGRPSVLVRDGVILCEALAAENMSEDELRAGLRKLGHDRVEDVRLAVLEETGHVTAPHS